MKVEDTEPLVRDVKEENQKLGQKNLSVPDLLH
jgi:hypothetical protein